MDRHLVAVWNPSYGSDVIESHVRILRNLAQRYRSSELDEDDVYVWWGKMRSSHRQAPLPHIADILAMEAEIAGADGTSTREMQLYLTDYRSLFVAHIGEITAEDVRDEEDSAEHVPAIYLEDGVNCDCWFRLWDIRRLVSDDTLSVVEELKKLQNTAYHNNPVSIYGGMVNLPLIVLRPDGARYFEHDVRAQLTDGKHWVEFDSERGGIGATERELREHCFGEEAWSRLDPGTRSFIATAEKLYRDHRADMAFDFSPILIDLAKAFEVQTNIILRKALARMKPLERTVNIDGRSVDCHSAGPFMLKDLANIIADCKEINDALKMHIAPPMTHWFTASLPAILRDLANIRNPAAHSTQMDRESVHSHRNRYLGVGCEGELVRLAKVRVV